MKIRKKNFFGGGGWGLEGRVRGLVGGVSGWMGKEN